MVYAALVLVRAAHLDPMPRGGHPSGHGAASSSEASAVPTLRAERERRSAARVSALLDRRGSCGLTLREIAEGIGRGSYVGGDEAA